MKKVLMLLFVFFSTTLFSQEPEYSASIRQEDYRCAKY